MSSGAGPHVELHEVTLLLASGSLDNADVHGHVAQVLGDGSSGASNGDLSGLNRDLDCIWS